nr:MAG TPA: hypothetical protein [Caudoviricetes sp.]DAS46015.1 MAG TPA: hypothetical protein [Caudoviricetes sp.]
MIETHMQPVQRIGQCIKTTAKVYCIGMGQR